MRQKVKPNNYLTLIERFKMRNRRSSFYKCRNKVSIIDGAPGCGKTTILAKSIHHAIKKWHIVRVTKINDGLSPFFYHII